MAPLMERQRSQSAWVRAFFCADCAKAGRVRSAAKSSAEADEVESLIGWPSKVVALGALEYATAGADVGITNAVRRRWYPSRGRFAATHPAHAASRSKRFEVALVLAAIWFVRGDGSVGARPDARARHPHGVRCVARERDVDGVASGGCHRRYRRGGRARRGARGVAPRDLAPLRSDSNQPARIGRR